MAQEDFSNPEEFRPTDVAGVVTSTLVSTGCILLLAGLLLWFLVSAGLGVTGVPLPALWGALITIGLLALLMWLKSLQVRRQLRDTKIVVSPEGLAQHDSADVVRFIPWQGMTAGARVAPIGKMGKVRAGTAASKKLGEAAGQAALAAGKAIGASPGIVGHGRIDFSESLGASGRALYDGAFGHSEDGRPLVGISPALIAKDWSSGRIGDWVAHFRPDILSQVRELEAPKTPVDRPDDAPDHPAAE